MKANRTSLLFAKITMNFMKEYEYFIMGENQNLL
jgi:hypothetical protein